MGRNFIGAELTLTGALFPAAPARRMRFCARLLFCAASLLVSLTSLAQVNHLTRGNDNARTGANLNETILTPANVGSGNFGKLFSVHTDGQIYAQPLYVSNLAIAGGTHNVVYVASMLNTIYALDADTGAVLWQQNYGSPIIPQDVETDGNIVWSTRIGILSTPVIDGATNVMYFVSGYQPSNGAQQFAYYLNAIDITDGSPVHGSPVSISATYSTPDLAAPLIFNAKIHGQRPSLALANGNVYLAFGSHEDQNAYHGWILAYSLSTLAQTAVYSDTTIGSEGGIWNAGQAPVIDGAGNLYYSTGNGSFGKTPNNLLQTGNSFIKLSPTLELLDYFTPYNSGSLNSGDMDLGSAGLLLLPGTNYLLGGGKQGVLYLVNTNGMGGFNASADQVRQEFQAVYGKGTSHIHGTPVYFDSDGNGPSTYVWGENDVLRGFLFNANTGLVKTTPFATSNMTAPVTNNDGAMPGGFLSVSANGGSNGIVWASTPYNGDALHRSVQGVLYAFNADTLALLWSDKTNDARDEIGMFAKYVPPMVANGKMYVPSFGKVGTNDGTGYLVVYGLLKAQLTVKVANASMTAGGPLPTFTGTVSGLTNGDKLGQTITVTYSTTATSGSAPGTYPITAAVTGSSAGNYNVVDTDGTLTISSSSQPLTVTANNATRVYGAANPAFTGTVTGAKPGDTFTESFSTTANAGSQAGNYAIVPSVSGANLANYTVTYVNGTLAVTSVPTTTALSAPASAVYGTNVTLIATVTSSSGTPAGSVTFRDGATILGTATLNGSGVATLATTATPAGNDTVIATYAGTANYDASTSAPSSITVSAATQTITFAAVASRAYGSAPFAVSATSSAGSSLPVTITVQSGPATINGGIVTVKGVGAVVLLATQPGNNNYSAASTTQAFQVTPAPLMATANNASRTYNVANPAFSGTITGAVGGDSFLEAFTSSATLSSNVGSYAIVPALSGTQLGNYTVTYVNGTLSVTAAATTTVLNAPASAANGASVTLTATVTSASGTPAGVVTFQNGTTTLGTVTLSGNGVAVLSTTLPAGTDSLTATYIANGNFGGSSSSPSSITVGGAGQTITWSGIATRSYGNAPFTVSATSNLGSSYPVTIGVLSGPATINGGVVTLTGAGTVVLQAMQAGDAQHPAVTTTQSFQVLPALLTITAGNATRAYGLANPAFSGTIAGAVGGDSFTETFASSATLNSNVGSYAIVPALSGTQLANYTVTYVNGTLSVTAAATTTALNAPASAANGASVTLTATVTSASGTPAGVVTFQSGAIVLGTVALNGNGVAILSAALPAGTDSLTATYVANGNFGGSTSSPSSIIVSGGSENITWSGLGSRSYGNAPFAVSATSSLGSSYPVTISVLSGPATINGAVVTLTGAGTVVLQAMQAGNAQHPAVTTTQSFQVLPALLTITAGNATRVYGAANPEFNGSVSGAVGSDSFTESFSSSATAISNAGSYAIVPAVSGAGLVNYSVNAVNGTLTVTPASTSTALSAPGAAAYGTSVTLTSTVSSAAGVPSGTVTFYAGSTPLGAGTLTGGAASFTTLSLPAGQDALTAVYAGSGNFAASTSALATIAIGSPSQTIAFPSIATHTYGDPGFAVAASSSLGSAYPVTVTVLSGPATINGGTLNFTGAGIVVLQAIQPGDAQHHPAVATQTFQVLPAGLTVSALSATRIFAAANPVLTGTLTGVVGDDRFMQSFTTPATSASNVGNYPIVPSLSGARLSNYTVHVVNGTLTVTAAATTVTLSAPANSAYGAPVTLTATVGSVAGTPGGTVTFSLGSTLLGSGTLNAGGVATLNSASLPAGSDVITATYAAAGNFLGSSSPTVTLVVTAAPIPASGNYTFAASPSSLTLAGVATAKTMLTFTPTGGYSGTVALSCVNLPANASCQFAQNQIVLSGDNKPVSLGLSLSATRPQAKLDLPQTATTAALFALTFWWPGSLAGLTWFVRRRKLLPAPARVWQLYLLLAASVLLIGGLSGCGAHGTFVTTTTSSQVTILATGTSGNLVTTQNIILTVNMTE